MGVQTKEITKEWNAKLYKIVEALHETQDYKSAKKVSQLIDKLENNELMLAFCGHFSAGKSSFINELLQEQILPASPIPTSANVVTIKKGEEKARVYFFDGEPLEILPPIQFDHVKKFAKEGDKVESVLYQYPFQNLPDKLVVLDTPGIDSTDDAHRVSTESALHLADIIFYVMDYNHVQSEVNLQFIKELQQQGKRVYLIVNQIDKHQENEIPFFTYKSRIEQSFQDWGIQYPEIFYTSLKVQNHQLNELNNVKQLVKTLTDNQASIMEETIARAIETIFEEHNKWLFDQNDEKLTSLENKMISSMSKEDLQKEIAEHTATIKKLQDQQVSIQKTFDDGIENIITNAHITPFEMRELSKNYLESRQKNFKVGLLFSKKKTEEEQQIREEKLLHDIQERVTTQLKKHLDDYILKFIKEKSVFINDLSERLEACFVEIDTDYLQKHVKPGAGVTGDSVLNFTKDIASSIRRDYKQKVVKLMEPIFVQILEESNQQIQQLKEKKVHAEQAMEAAVQYEQLIHDLNNKVDYLKEQLSASIDIISPHAKEIMVEYLKENVKQIKGDQLELESTQVKTPKEKAVQVTNESISSPVEQVIEKIGESIAIIQPLKGFEKVAEELKQKANKLSNQTFTVALFGAFSAGKSSFANALFGDKVLPVSPNPTTASINKISPVTENNPHGTVHVSVKSEADLLEDLQLALSYFNKNASSMDDVLKQVESLLKENHSKEVDTKSKPHYSFLSAFYQGWSEMKDKLGSLLSISLEDFPAYVAEETKACFVEWMEVFYDCDITRQGITLVDTPGADSVNARHTEVSFEYIKNSDAILFVTYYQHAFSKADREFLIQLGRVKDAFSLDKMFFVVNAADLANTKEELDLVTDYVESQLLEYGIRNPRLFPLSSLLALKEKLGEEVVLPSFMQSSQISAFEQSFYHFIKNDLLEMSVHAAKVDLQRTASKLSSILAAANESVEEKEQKRVKIETNKKTIHEMVTSYSMTPLQSRMEKEVSELLFYCKQRVFFRFADFFKDAFNPAVLQDNNNPKQQLPHCLKELMKDMEFDIAQEVRATTVRMEKFIHSMMKDWYVEMEKRATQVDVSCTFPSFQEKSIDALSIQASLESLSAKAIKEAFSHFRNAKSFFEKNEKVKMVNSLEENLSPIIDLYLQQNKEKLNKHYEAALGEYFGFSKNLIDEEVMEYYGSILNALVEKLPIDEWEKAEQQLTSILNEG
ncbi:dynamin family protein [Bacillus alkalisoli]|uniref:dynamin family protein n=1 Tax=Bacillus alkalisoli TaxID=2011008 RepID=UPI000C23BA56|nr:dynamin family protein [Bacillus alkalisoli]